MGYACISYPLLTYASCIQMSEHIDTCSALDNINNNVSF